MAQIRIVLLSADGKTIHAEGALDYEKIADYAIVERNTHFYQYSSKKSSPRLAEFHEVLAPYHIVEF